MLSRGIPVRRSYKTQREDIAYESDSYGVWRDSGQSLRLPIVLINLPSAQFSSVFIYTIYNTAQSVN